MSQGWTDHSPREVLPNVVCLNECVKPRQGGGPGPVGAVELWGEILLLRFLSGAEVKNEWSYISNPSRSDVACTWGTLYFIYFYIIKESLIYFSKAGIWYY